MGNKNLVVSNDIFVAYIVFHFQDSYRGLSLHQFTTTGPLFYTTTGNCTSWYTLISHVLQDNLPCDEAALVLKPPTAIVVSREKWSQA